jgi:uncharacterized protein YndB with AHSA1/START domain
MGKGLTAEVSITIHAPVQRVWKALTDPAMIKEYLFGTETISDWKVGSSLRFRGVWEGKPYEDKGTILALEPEKLLKYDYWSSFSGTPDIPENYANVIYSLSATKEGTVVTVTQDGIKTEEARDHSIGNWKMILEGMAKLIS